MTQCDYCGDPATICQRADRVCTNRCDDHALPRDRYQTKDLLTAKAVRLAQTQRALHTPGRMFR